MLTANLKTGADGADEIRELRMREKEQGIEPDWEINSFMRASVARGKRHSIMADYVMRMLGLEVCLCNFLSSSSLAPLLQRHKPCTLAFVKWSGVIFPPLNWSAWAADLRGHHDRQPAYQGHQWRPEEASDHRQAFHCVKGCSFCCEYHSIGLHGCWDIHNLVRSWV